MTVQALLIDLDGTLVDTAGDFEVAINAMRQAYGLDPVERTAILQWVGRGSRHLVSQALADCAHFADAPRAIDEALERYLVRYAEINGTHSRLFPGVAQGLDALGQQGYRLACVTNKPQHLAEQLLRYFRLESHFTVVLGGGTVPRLKPDPLPFLSACQRLETDPSATLVIGDSESDVQAARAAGCKVVVVSYGYRQGKTVQSLNADGIVDSISQAGEWARQQPFTPPLTE